jgi:hypothetical protein
LFYYTQDRPADYKSLAAHPAKIPCQTPDKPIARDYESADATENWNCLSPHPSAPFWKRKDVVGAWTIPKGMIGEGEDFPEDFLTPAKREFHEITGLTARGPYVPLGEVYGKEQVPLKRMLTPPSEQAT